MKNLFQQLAILALAMVSVLGAERAFAASADLNTPPTPRLIANILPPSKPPATTPQQRILSARATGRTYDPWRMSFLWQSQPSTITPSAMIPSSVKQPLEALGSLSGSIVVVDPNTGRMLTIVNQKLALSSGFTPCSTFKPIVALAALREGLITPNTRLYVGQHTRMNVTDALAHSNNPFFLKLGEMLGFKRITEYAQEFGLGRKGGRRYSRRIGRTLSLRATQGRRRGLSCLLRNRR